MQHLWDSVDSYLEGLFVEADPLLDWVVKEQESKGLPAIQVSALEGKLLQIVASAMKAKHVLEIGTLGGYSAILLARALPSDGKVITLEVDPKHAGVANEAFSRAGLADKIELRLGAALETLPELKSEGYVFDFIFIDADKESNAHYVKHALDMSHPGTLIVVDNVIRDGDVINHDSNSPMSQGVQRMNEYVKSEPRLSVTAIQTVGSKGYDGMSFMLVKG